MKPGNRFPRGRAHGAKFRQSQFWKMRAHLRPSELGRSFSLLRAQHSPDAAAMRRSQMPGAQTVREVALR